MRIKNGTTIFRRKNKMVKQNRYIMALMNIFAHPSSLRPKGRGIKPGEIQYILKAKKNIVIDNEQFAKTSEKIKELYKPYQKKSYVVQAAGLILPILIITNFAPNDGKIWAI